MTKATVTARGNVNIREEPNITCKILGQLHNGDFVYGAVKDNWIGFQRVYRFNGTVEEIAGYVHTAYTAEVEESEPVRLEVEHVFVTFKGGGSIVDDKRLIGVVQDALS